MKLVKKCLIFMLAFLVLCNSVLLGQNMHTVYATDTVGEGNSATNIIRNGDFEATSGDKALNISPSKQAGEIGSSQWRYFYSSASGLEMNMEVSNEGRTGNAMKVYPGEVVTADKDGKAVIMQNKITGFEENKKYILTAYIKAKNTPDDSKMIFAIYNGASQTRINTSYFNASSCGEWTKITKEFTAAASKTDGNNDRLEIQIEKINTGYWLLDDISIIQVPTIAVSTTNVALKVGESTEISVNQDDPHNVLGTTPVLTWSSNNTDAATIDSNGKVTAVGEGTATITVTAAYADGTKSVTAECIITVSANQESGDTTEDTIIRNGSFEATNGDKVLDISPSKQAGDIGSSQWRYFYSSASGLEMNMEVSNEGRTGNAMKVYPGEVVTADKDGKAVIMQNKITGFEENKKYILTAYIKAKNTPDDSKMIFAIYNGASQTRINTSYFNASSCGEWTKITKEFTAAASKTDGNNDRLEIQIEKINTGYWLLDDISIIQVPTIAVNTTNVALKVGESTEISVNPDDPHNVLGTIPVLTWSSNNTDVATIDSTGNVTAVGEGAATITVTAAYADGTKSVTAECIITVSANQESGDTTEDTIIRNGSFEATTGDKALNIQPGSGGGGIGNSDWRYHISTATKIAMNMEVVAGVGRTGNAMKVYPDASVTTATAGKGLVLQNKITGLEAGKQYILTLYAKAVNVDDSRINARLYNGLESNGTNRLVDTDIIPASSCSDGWTKISKEFIAYAPKTTGNADSLEIHMENLNNANGYWLLDDISIVRVPIITIDKTEINLEAGNSVEVSVSLDDPHGVLGNAPVLSWSSDDVNVATVIEESGKVSIKAVGTGEAVIKVSVNYADGTDIAIAECVVTVVPQMIIFNGDFAQEADAWTTDAGTDVTYTSVAEGRTGNALKLALSEGVTGPAVGTFKQLLDTKVSDGLLVNGSKYLVTVYAKPVEVNGDSTVTVFWHDSDSATAQKAEIQAGTSIEWIPVTFAFTTGDMSAVGTKLEVQASNLTSGYWLFDDISIKRMPYISLSPAVMNIIAGERVEIDAAMVDPDFILNKTGAFNYSSADTSIATVDLRGRVTGVSAGTTTITVTNAYDETYSATCTVNVSAIDLTTISIPESMNLCEAEQQALAVTFTPANATNQAISWTSSDAGVAVVNENGLVTGMKAGIATITATGANNLTASCTVTVCKSTTLLTEEATITSTTYQEVVDSFVEFVTNNTSAEASYSLYESPENGVLTVNEDGSFSYIPRNGQVGDSETFMVIVNAGTEYAFIKGTIELVDTIGDSNTPSDSDITSDSDTPSDSDTDTDSDAQAPEIVGSASDDSYTLGSNAEVTIKSTGDFAKFESVEMDGKVVDPSNYDAYEGSTVIKFKSAYLETLSEGEHIVTINYKDGSDVDAKLTLVKKADTDTNADSNNEGDNESEDDESGDVVSEVARNTGDSTKATDETKTGDNSNMELWLLLLAVAMASLGCLGCTLYKKNKGGK